MYFIKSAVNIDHNKKNTQTPMDMCNKHKKKMGWKRNESCTSITHSKDDIGLFCLKYSKLL